mgnify:CR=1 FL=1
MVKIQVDLDEDEDRIVDVFRAENRLKSKERAIKELIKKVGNGKWEVTEKDRNGAWRFFHE